MGFLVDEKSPIVWRGLMVMSAVQKLIRQVRTVINTSVRQTSKILKCLFALCIVVFCLCFVLPSFVLLCLFAYCFAFVFVLEKKTGELQTKDFCLVARKWSDNGWVGPYFEYWMEAKPISIVQTYFLLSWKCHEDISRCTINVLQ